MLRVSRLKKDQWAPEAPQISEMSDTAVSSLTANGLGSPSSLVVVFCCDPPGIRSSDLQLLTAAQQKKGLWARANRAEPSLGRSRAPRCAISDVSTG